MPTGFGRLLGLVGAWGRQLLVGDGGTVRSVVTWPPAQYCARETAAH
jgi:hypothetical protein